MTEGTILYRRENDACLIKLVGCIRFTIGARFEAFIRQLFVEDPPVHLTIDLTEADHIDSTNLGLLARLSRYMSAHGAELPVINTDRDDMILLLETMGFDEVFSMQSMPSVSSDQLSEISFPEDVSSTDSRTILDAHQMLMNMNKGNEERFRDAVEFMKKEMEP